MQWVYWCEEHLINACFQPIADFHSEQRSCFQIGVLLALIACFGFLICNVGYVAFWIYAIVMQTMTISDAFIALMISLFLVALTNACRYTASTGLMLHRVTKLGTANPFRRTAMQHRCFYLMLFFATIALDTLHLGATVSFAVLMFRLGLASLWCANGFYACERCPPPLRMPYGYALGM